MEKSWKPGTVARAQVILFHIRESERMLMPVRSNLGKALSKSLDFPRSTENLFLELKQASPAHMENGTVAASKHLYSRPGWTIDLLYFLYM